MEEDKTLSGLKAYRQIEFSENTANSDFLANIKVQVTARRRTRRMQLSTGMAVATVFLAVVIANFNSFVDKSWNSDLEISSDLLYSSIFDIYDFELDDSEFAKIAEVTLETETSDIYSDFSDTGINNTYDFIASMDDEEFEIMLEKLKNVNVITYGT